MRSLRAAASRGGQAGFTLLEVLVVVALIGLMSALALPSLQRVVAGVENATRRAGVLADLNSLGYRAFVLGQSFDLAAPTASGLLRDGNPVLTLPAGWRIEAQAPIHFSFSGYCGGGVLTLWAPDGSGARVALEAPMCRVQPSAAS